MKKTFYLMCILLIAAGGGMQADDWPQWRGPNRDGVWKETGLIDAFDGPEISRRWTAKISSGYSGPTIADGRVYVMDRLRQPEDKERIHCFDWKSGKKLWTHAYLCPYNKVKYPAGPRASVTIHDGKAYALGTTAVACCLDAKTGKVVWQKDLDKIYKVRHPIWGIAASPLIEKEKLILQIGGSDGACVVALNRNTGEEIWRALEDPASYSSPIMIDQAGKRIIACWTGSRLVGLDVNSGELHWAHEVGFTRWVIGIATPVFDQNRILVTSVDKGSMLVRVNPDQLTSEQLWSRYGKSETETQALQSLISTPVLTGETIYGASRDGVLRGLDAKTGDRLWANETVTPVKRFGTVFLVRNDDRYWLFNERGELIICDLSPKGYEEISRAKLLKPTTFMFRQRDGVVWSHPGFAYKHIFARNDEELVCASLEAK